MIEGPPRSSAPQEKKPAEIESKKNALSDLSPDEIKIIEEHATNPELRAQYLSNPQYREARSKANLIGRITYARTFEQLYQGLDEAGPLQGSQEIFEPERLKEVIDRVRKGEALPEELTRTAGLRESVIRLMKTDGERKPNPDSPSHIEGSEIISKGDFKRYVEYYGGDYRERLGPHAGYPAIGAEGLRTPEGGINGRLVWCDGVEAIFETPQGYLKIKFKKLIGPSGKTFEQMAMEEGDAQRRRQERPQARAREIPRS